MSKPSAQASRPAPEVCIPSSADLPAKPGHSPHPEILKAFAADEVAVPGPVEIKYRPTHSRPTPFMLEYVALGGATERIDLRPLLSRRGWNDGERRTFWPVNEEEEEGPALILTNDNRWVVFTIDWAYDRPEAERAAPEPARELSESKAFDWLVDHGYDVPLCLQGRSLAGGTAPTADQGGPKAATEAGPQEVVGPAGRAVGAAYELRDAGRPISIRSVCRKAGVDRNNLTEKYPEVVKLIEQLAEPDRTPPRGSTDRRTPNLEAWDSPDDD
jgi:hypothetical protein